MQARAEGYTVRGLVVINPGNPTGQVSRSRPSSFLTGYLKC